MDSADVITIGAGAAGLTAAIFAARTDRQVILLERSPQAGRKILMSGGTRCNVLPVRATLDDFVTESSRNRLRNIFKSWSVELCRKWFEEEIGLAMACETETNKWFPKSNSAREVRDLLLQHAESLGVRIRYSASVSSIEKEGDHWVTGTESGQQFRAPSVIIATGGLSIPGSGTDGTGHSLVQKLGHTLHPPYPALTPLKGPHPGGWGSLPGVSLDVSLAPENLITGKQEAHPFQPAGNRSQKRDKRNITAPDAGGGFLFTHKGYSGPAVLDISHVVVKAHMSGKQSAALRVNWTGKTEQWWRTQLDGKSDTTTLLRRHLPKRLADNLLADNGLSERKTAQLTKQEREQLITDVIAYRIIPTGHFGFDKAEVTGGGVPLDEINPATMESRIAPGLYLCGEILDVFGRIGGFNFYWAWVTGRLSGMRQE